MAVETEIEEMTPEEKLELFETFGRTSSEHDGKIIRDENQEVIKVEYSTFFALLRSCGGYHVIAMLNLSMIVYMCASNYISFYIGNWAKNPSLQKDGYNKFAEEVLSISAICGVLTFIRFRINAYMQYKSG